MSEVTLLDLIFSDTFCDIQKFLSIKDLFTLRCVSTDFLNYIDIELKKLKNLQLPSQDDQAINPFRVLCNKCRMLETINLSNNKWLTDDLVEMILDRNAETLIKVNLNKCSSLTATVVQPVIIKGTKLRKISLQDCSWLTVGCLEAIAFHQTQLEELDLSNCKMISEQCLIVLLSNFRQLKMLALASVPSVSDNVLFTLSKFQTKIQHLNLFSCSLITDRGIGALSLNCKKLETLSIRGCGKITDRSLELLRARNVRIDVPKNNNTEAFLNQFRRVVRLDQDLYFRV